MSYISGIPAEEVVKTTTFAIRERMNENAFGRFICSCLYTTLDQTEALVHVACSPSCETFMFVEGYTRKRRT